MYSETCVCVFRIFFHVFRQGAGRTDGSTNRVNRVLPERLILLPGSWQNIFYCIPKYVFAYSEPFFTYSDKALVERAVLPEGCW